VSEESDRAAELQARVDGVRRHVGGWNAVRGGAVGGAVAAVAAAYGEPVGAAVMTLLGIALGASLRPGPRDAARRLDEAAELDGQVECAWDHLGRDTPMVLAQRRRALKALADRADLRVVRPPSPAWSLLLLSWAWPLLSTPGEVSDRSEPDHSIEALAAARGAGGTDRADAHALRGAADAGTRAVAHRMAPDAGATGDGGRGSGAPTTAGRRGGVGARAGERAGGAAGRAATDVRAGAGPELVVPRAAGVGVASPGTAPRPQAGPGPIGRAPLDDVADPARPYPRRYHEVVSAWFGRDARGRLDRVERGPGGK